MIVNTSKTFIFVGSIAIRDLMGLVYETLEEALQCSPDCAKQLYYVSKLIFHLYLSVVPTYHKESLATLPQLAGWYMFILLILGKGAALSRGGVFDCQHLVQLHTGFKSQSRHMLEKSFIFQLTAQQLLNSLALFCTTWNINRIINQSVVMEKY